MIAATTAAQYAAATHNVLYSNHGLNKACLDITRRGSMQLECADILGMCSSMSLAVNAVVSIINSVGF